MTEHEFSAVRASTVAAYVAEQVAAGLGEVDLVRQRALEQMDDLLPDGLQTPGMLLFVAELQTGEAVGHVWLGLERRVSPPGTAWLYGIEVVPHARNHGYGRALLAAAEDSARSHGATAMGLNVFAANAVARHIYESAGYLVTAQQMRKPLGAALVYAELSPVVDT